MHIDQRLGDLMRMSNVRTSSEMCVCLGAWDFLTPRRFYIGSEVEREFIG